MSVWIDVKSPPGRHMKRKIEILLVLCKCSVSWIVAGSCCRMPCGVGYVVSTTRFEPVMAILALHFDVPSSTDCFTVLMCAACPSPSMLNTCLLHIFWFQPCHMGKIVFSFNLMILLATVKLHGRDLKNLIRYPNTVQDKIIVLIRLCNISYCSVVGGVSCIKWTQRGVPCNE